VAKRKKHFVLLILAIGYDNIHARR